MKQWTTRILLCLFLGVVTTVGVSWWVLWTWDPGSAYEKIIVGYSTEDRDGWLVNLDDNFFGRLSISMGPAISKGPASENDTGQIEVISDMLPPWSSVHQTVPHGRNVGIIDYAGGWPKLALRYKLTVDADQPNPEWVISGGFPAGASPFLAADDFKEFRALPYTLILPGFLIDTALYGFIWFALFVSIYASRKAIRRKRGQCTKCGYDLRGNQSSIGQRVLNPPPDSQAPPDSRLCHQSAGCPECGWNRLETSEHLNVEMKE